MSKRNFAGSKRERALDANIDDNFDVESGRYRPIPEGSMTSLDKRIRRMDEKNAAGEPKSQSKPLYKLSARQLQSYYGLVGALSQTIEENIVRPKDPAVLGDLRRREASAHSSSSAISISVYKSRTPNTRYASQGPLGWMQQPTATAQSNEEDAANQTYNGNNSVALSDTWARNSIIMKHVHNKEDVLILDIRFPCGSGVSQKLPPALTRNVLFPYLSLPANEKTVLQHMSQHNTFVRFAEEFDREDMRGTIEDVMKRSTSMSFFAIRFMHDEQVQIVYHMDLDAIYFGVLVFSFLAPNGAKMNAIQADGLRLRIKSEINKEREKDSAKAQQPAATLSSLITDAEVLDELEQMRRLGDSYCKPHAEVALSAAGTKVDRLIGRSCPLSVFRPEKSPILMGSPIKFEYSHFSTCQCRIDDDDLATYREAYGAAARQKPTPIPAYDSDNEKKSNK
jgi:hypothetical protein